MTLNRIRLHVKRNRNRYKRGNSALDIMVALVIVGFLGLAMTQLTEMSRGSRQTDNRGYGQAVAGSVAAAIRTQPYTKYPDANGYSFATTSNDRNWPVQLTIENRLEGGNPEYDVLYPDTGVQRIHVGVQDPQKQEMVAQVEFIKYQAQ